MPDASSIDAGGGMLCRLRRDWLLKLLLTLGLNLFFWAGYGYLSRHALFPVRTPALTWMDRVIPFQPAGWSGLYLSEFLVTALVPWLITGRDGLRRYAMGLLALSGVSFLIFLFVPVASPRPAWEGGEGLHRFILRWDGQYNAFPSLHAGFLVYTLALAWRMFRFAFRPRVWCLAGIWAGLVLYSTLATRQHYSVDLAAGGILGIAADALAWRRSSIGARAARITLRRKGVVSQSGCK